MVWRDERRAFAVRLGRASGLGAVARREKNCVARAAARAFDVWPKIGGTRAARQHRRTLAPSCGSLGPAGDRGVGAARTGGARQFWHCGFKNAWRGEFLDAALHVAAL